jgi:hypothetical protein
VLLGDRTQILQNRSSLTILFLLPTSISRG